MIRARSSGNSTSNNYNFAAGWKTRHLLLH
jgi:hypothetical protein